VAEVLLDEAQVDTVLEEVGGIGKILSPERGGSIRDASKSVWIGW
jgi:hypothetical protein